MLAIIALLAFSTVVVGAFELLRPKRDRVVERILRAGEERPAYGRQVEGSLLARTATPRLRRLGNALAAALPQNIAASLERRLTMAGDPWTLPGFLATWALFAVGGVGFTAYLALSVPGISTLQLAILAAGLLPAALLLPYARLRRRVRVRQRAIIRGLPDAMDLLVTSVEAGLAVDAAIALVAEKTEGPLSEVFQQYLRQVGLGRGRRAALEYVAVHSGVRELIAVARSVAQGEELGTSVGDVLRERAEDLRIERRQRAEIAAQRAPVLMTIPLVLCFLPALGAVVVVPSILNLIDFIGGLGSTG